MTEQPTISLSLLSRDLGLDPEQVETATRLLDEGNSIPFIARYRKDATGNLDEDHLRRIADRLKELRSLAERKQTILRSIESLGKLTPELEKKILDARMPRRLEDLYLPYKPKKQTLAAAAREKGLDVFALEILNADEAAADLTKRAADFVNEDKKVLSAAEALLGAGHVLSEMYGERVELRQRIREIFQRSGKLISKKIKPESEDIEEPVAVTEVSAETTAAAPAESADAATEAAPVTELQTPETETAQETEAAVETPVEAAETTVETAVETPEAVIEAPVETTEAPESAESSEPAEPSEQTEPAVQAESPKTPESPESSEMAEQAAAEQSVAADGKAADVKSPRPPKPSKKEKAKTKKKKTAAELKAEQEEKLYSDYFDFSADVRSCPSYRILAINRGERAKVLRVRLEADAQQLRATAERTVLPEEHPHREFLSGCLTDALERLVAPSIEREIRRDLTDEAERQAVSVFAKNLRNLLLQKPLFRRRVLAIDPGFRYGCKMVALDEFGNFLANETVYITGSAERRAKAMTRIVELIEKFDLAVIVIGNGTGCREAEDFVAKMIAERLTDREAAYIIVNEAGASVYSVSPAAKEEFPHYDSLVRGAISIGRRLQDPLNELVKIDPASLGVGIYQHDLKAKHLRESLGEVVESCVNYVGVDLNSATPAILKYVAGLNQLVAKRIYEYRVEHGPFRYRDDLKKVAGLGDAAFANAAGFLKINDGYEPLDRTWIHPESYPLAEKILAKLGFTKDDLKVAGKRAELAEKIPAQSVKELADEFGAGIMTVADILDQFKRPGRDPREALPAPIFKKGVMKLEDLAPGMELMGTVLNVVDFGAFVDIGLHDSGLIHISRMGDRFVRDAHQRLAVGDIVKVWVVEVDSKRRRISLSMLPPGTERTFEPRRRPKQGAAPAEGERPERPVGERQGGERQGGERPSGDRPRRENRPVRRNESDGAAVGGESRREDRPARSERSDRPSRPAGQGGSFGREGGRSPDRRGDRSREQEGRGRDARRGGRFDNRPKTPRSAEVAAKKEIKPISDQMKTGKEPMRSFSDLAQLFGRVEATPEESAKPKQEKPIEKTFTEKPVVEKPVIEKPIVETPVVEKPSAQGEGANNSENGDA